MRSIEIMVIGGGASGMMAAITAAEAGAKVLLIEKLNRVGKKLLATGNGRCNFTNQKQKPEYYHSRTEGAAWPTVSAFDEKQVITWFRERGLLSMDRDGYVYPRSAQALSVVQILERMLRMNGVEIHTGESVEEIIPFSGKQKAYKVCTSAGAYLARRVILAVGGAASPVHGTCGDGYDLVKNLGISVIPPVPALTSLVLEGKYCKLWAGVRIQGQVGLYLDGKLLVSDQGEIQMTAYGISGIPVFQISYLAARLLAEGKKPYLILDSMMEFSREGLLQELQQRQSRFLDKGLSVADILEGMLPGKLISAYIKEISGKKISASTAAEKVTKAEWENLVWQIKEKKLLIHSVSDFDKAQVSSGGVDLSELDTGTMELKEYPGLYIVGELADVDGICGGYNLQWAWSSGHAAGKASVKDLKFR